MIACLYINGWYGALGERTNHLRFDRSSEILLQWEEIKNIYILKKYVVDLKFFQGTILFL